MKRREEKVGKGDKPRPRLIDRKLYDLRWALAFGKITFKEYAQKAKEIKTKPRR